MNELLLLGGGTLVAYLLLRHKDATAATPAPAVLATPGMQPPVLQVPTLAPKPNPPQAPPSTRPPQITTPSPPSIGEVSAPKQPAPVVLTGRWGWPVPRWQGRAPVISDGFGSPRPPGKHMGADLMFARVSSDPFPSGPNGTKRFVMPDAWMAVAASDGVLWSAGHTPRGFAVVLDHGNVATFYQHLDVLFVPEINPPAKATPSPQLIPIKAGQPLGVIGADPLDPARLKHLHFELWPAGPASAIDPQPFMTTWQIFTPHDIAPFLPALNADGDSKVRNAALTYRPVGASGEPYPDWVRALDGKSGVYVLRETRDDGTTEIVYIGESHSGRLYQTLTRHFQTWRRAKKFWSGQYTGSQSHDPGLTYDRERITAAVRVLPADSAIAEEARLIARLRPRDNLIGQPDGDLHEAVPF